MSDLRHIFKLARGELQSTLDPSENTDDHIALPVLCGYSLVMTLASHYQAQGFNKIH